MATIGGEGSSGGKGRWGACVPMQLTVGGVLVLRWAIRAAVLAGVILSAVASGKAATLPPTLNGEGLAAHTLWTGTPPSCFVEPSEWFPTASFCLDGTATGPYPGTFHAEGTFSTVSTDPSATEGEDYGNVTVYTVKFTIDSPVGRVSATETLNPAITSTYQFGAGMGGWGETLEPRTGYSATISLGDGGVYGDTGTAGRSLSLIESGEGGSEADLSDSFGPSADTVTVITPPTPPPASVTPPTIGGSFVQGQTLYESHGGWSGSPSSYSYQWERCDSSGSNCSAIAGSTATSYTLTALDAGATVRVQEWASNGAGTGGPAVSATTPTIQALPATATPSPGPAPPAQPVPPSSAAGEKTTSAPSTPTAKLRLAFARVIAIQAVLREDGYTWRLTAPHAGRLVVAWYQGDGLIAVGAERIKKAGLVQIRVRLTGAGRRLLRAARALKLKAKVTYTPSDGPPVFASRPVRLRR